jgi:hypothetical protein
MKASVLLILTSVLGLVGPLATGSAHAAIRAVIVGIDRYTHVPILRGAVADARDLQEALEQAGAEVALLIDDAATRANIMAVWNAFAAETGEDDVLILSFAGHGIQVPDLDGDEADGYDEAFVLPGFRPGSSDDANLILDDSIDQVIRAAAPNTVVLITDTCHSGTFLRAGDPRVTQGTVRFVPPSAYAGRDRAPTAGSGVVSKPAENVLFFGAVPEELLVAEVLIDRVPRGALSYAFARAVEGEADRNEDSSVTAEELRTYVPERVRAVSQSRQTPVVLASQRVLQHFRLRIAAGATAVEPAPVASGAAADWAANSAQEVPGAGPETEKPWTDELDGGEPVGSGGGGETTLTLALDGPDAASGRPVLGALKGVEIVPSADRADLIWHLPSGDVLTSLGDVAARLGPARDPRLLQGVVTKWRLLRALDRRIDGSLQARVLPADRVFHRDEAMTVEILSRVEGRLALFDLASDGSLIRIVPRLGQPAPSIAAGQTVRVPLRAGPPFGADHIVAAVLPDPSAIETFLRTHHGRPVPPLALGPVLDAIDAGAVLAAAVYTAP